MFDIISILGEDYKINDESDEAKGNLKAFRNQVIRHEVVHAFFCESGLENNSDFATNEELVDWIAIQIPKICEVMNSLGILGREG